MIIYGYVYTPPNLTTNVAGYMTIHRVTAPKLCGTEFDNEIVSTVAPTIPPMNRTEGEGVGRDGRVPSSGGIHTYTQPTGILLSVVNTSCYCTCVYDSSRTGTRVETSRYKITIDSSLAAA